VHHQGGDLTDTQPWGVKIENGMAVCRCRFCDEECGTVEELHKHEVNHIMETSTNNNNEFIDRAKNLSALGVGNNLIHPPMSMNLTSFSADELFPPEFKPSSLNESSLTNNNEEALTYNRTKPITSPPKRPLGGRGSRRIACPHCPKHFKLRYFLEQHLRTHSGETPYACSNCGVSFSMVQSLRMHEQRCGSLEANAVEIGDGGFPSSADVNTRTASRTSNYGDFPTGGLSIDDSCTFFLISDVVGSESPPADCDGVDARGGCSIQNSLNSVLAVEPVVIEPRESCLSEDLSYRDISSVEQCSEIIISIVKSMKEEKL